MPDSTAVYLDHAATTPLRPEVRDAMEPFLSEVFGNPSSTHRWGRRAAVALSRARERVAAALGAHADEIYFVRGGTESDNMALLGRATAARARGDVPTVAVSAVEHKAVLESADAVAENGGHSIRIGVEPTGELDWARVDEALESDAALISVMWVNNEVGLVLPIERLVARARAAGVVVHSDAVQAIGKVPIATRSAGGPDLLTLTGHKIHGPRGVGVLVVARGVDVRPLVFGGGQERGLRPGTEDVAGAVGLAEAVSLAVAEREDLARRLSALRDSLSTRLSARVPGLRVFAGEGPRAPHVLNVGVPGLAGHDLVAAMDLEGVAVSSGSACDSGASGTSHVLAALYSDADAFASVRFSFGHGSSERDVIAADDAFGRVTERVRATPAEAR